MLKSPAFSPWKFISDSILIAIGAVLEAVSIKFFLVPNNVIDGGLVGTSLILAKISNPELFVTILCIITFPFLILAYNTLGKNILIKMFIALVSFSIADFMMHGMDTTIFVNMLDSFELTITGAIILGIGVGMTIKYGGCLDGTEILALLIQKNKGVSVGRTIFIINIIVFTLATIAYNDVATGIKSLITYAIVSKVMDSTIAGFKEIKEVTIYSKSYKTIASRINSELRTGATLKTVESAYSGKKYKSIFIAIDKFKINELKQIINEEDKAAFIIIKDIIEYENGTVNPIGASKSNINPFF